MRSDATRKGTGDGLGKQLLLKEYSAGQAVDVHSFGSWYHGVVISLGRTRVKVRYRTGTGKERDKAFPVDLVRARNVREEAAEPVYDWWLVVGPFCWGRGQTPESALEEMVKAADKLKKTEKVAVYPATRRAWADFLTLAGVDAARKEERMIRRTTRLGKHPRLYSFVAE